MFNIEITSSDSDISISPPMSVVSIVDNDMIGIGLEEEEYETSEDENSVEICVVVTTGSIQRQLVASLVTVDISTGKRLLDYVEASFCTSCTYIHFPPHHSTVILPYNVCSQ